MFTETFYANLMPLDHFSDITQPPNFVPVPNDWYILITDIVGSTSAIAQGRYKDVNLIGACSIVAVLNIARHIDIPFVFGGDGASILIPPSLYVPARDALQAIQHLAKLEFGMDLRVGIVPVAVVTAAHYDVKIAKLRVSENYYQAVLTGGGTTHATELVKAPDAENPYRLKPLAKVAQADLTGLECRWQDIPSKHEEILSLIILETACSLKNGTNVYQDVLQTIETIYGSDVNYHPISDRTMRLTFSAQNLLKETKLRARSRQWLDKRLYLWKIRLANLLGLIFMRFRLKIGRMDWGTYKKILADATDYRKFDDMLRMVISGTAAQRERLIEYLESQYRAGTLIYGTHVSDRALMTCLVYEYDGPQVHFIDGADGGYTLAAKAMKARLHRKVRNWKTYVALSRRQQKVAREWPPSPHVTDPRVNFGN